QIPSVWPTVNGGLEVFDGFHVRDGAVAGELPFPRVYVFAMLSESEILYQLLRYGPRTAPAADLSTIFAVTGPAAASVSIAHRIMLRRSFFDCSEVHLTSLDDGKSGVRVFMAHATLRNATMARRPLPFFVKMGRRDKIFREWR